MNIQSPLVPQGSLEQKDKGRARVKIAVFFVLAVHGIGLMALLMQAGCRQQNTTPTDNENVGTSTQPEKTNLTETTTPPPVTTTNPATGTDLAAPTPTPTPTPAPTALPTEYTVVAGDTPAGIVKKFNNQFKLQALLDANPKLKPTAMHPGDKLVLPPASVPATGAPAPTSATAPQIADDEYKVKSGDTLTSIASTHGTTVKKLRDLNTLKTDFLKVGQKLKLPPKAALGTTTTTPPADSTSTTPR